MTEESTTPDLVEVVRRLFEASNRRDFDAVMRFYAPDGVWEATGIGQSFDGEAAIRGLYGDWVGGYEKHEIVLDEGKDLGNGVVFADLTQGGRLAGSTGEVRSREGWIFRFVDGKIVWVTGRGTLAAAERLAQERG
jgi:ketosteroid isomerase-like protein